MSTEPKAVARHSLVVGSSARMEPFTDGVYVRYEDYAALYAQVREMEADAQRYRWLRGPDAESTRYSRWRIEYWDGPNGWEPLQRERLDAAIDNQIHSGGPRHAGK